LGLREKRAAITEVTKNEGKEQLREQEVKESKEKDEHRGAENTEGHREERIFR